MTAPNNVNSYQQDVAYRLARTGGSGFTVFGYMGNPIGWGQIVQHQSPQLVGQGSTAIQPLDAPYAVQIMTAAAASPGTFVFNLYDLWGRNGNSFKVWDDLGKSQGYPYNTASDIVDLAIMQAQQDPSNLQITEWVRPIPGAMGAGNGTTGNAVNPYGGPTVTQGVNQSYGFRYHGATIVAVADGSTIQVGTLDVVKSITFNYTYATRMDKQGQTNVARTLFQ